MFNSIILRSRLPYYYHKIYYRNVKKPPISFGQYLRKEEKRNKEKRKKVIKEFYDYIQGNKK